MNTIKIGRYTHYLTDYAIAALRGAANASEAETAFKRYADDVPRRCRADVWTYVTR